MVQRRSEQNIAAGVGVGSRGGPTSNLEETKGKGRMEDELTTLCHFFLHNEVNLNLNLKSRRLFRFCRRELLSLFFIVGFDASHSFIGRFLPYRRSPLIRNPTILTLVLCSATTTTNPVGNIVRSLPSFRRSQFDGLLDSGTILRSNAASAT